MDNDLRTRIPRKQPDYHYATRYCPTEGCAQMYSIQTGARSGLFISASTYIAPSDTRQAIVVRCIKCNCVIDQEWADNALTAPPAALVYGRD